MSISSFKLNSFYPPLIQDYFNGELKNKNVIDWDYSLDELNGKSNLRNFQSRELLHKVLLEQNKAIALSSPTEKNISSILQEDTFTVCTGHQLCIYGGPAYFFSKIIDTITLAEKLNTQYPKHHHVPVFWMATEDHDFEEISSSIHFDNEVKWDIPSNGPVGKLNTSSMKTAHEHWLNIMGSNEKAEHYTSIFTEAYQSGKNLSEATRYFVNAIFGNKGIVIVDGDDPTLKTLMKEVFKQETFNQITQAKVDEQIQLLKGYKIQANPRAINLFYIENDYRARLEVNNGKVTTSDQQHEWSFDAFKLTIENNPESISPNVLLRPVYQELCLPNLAYIGGAGEISYWCELPLLFKALEVPFPVPVVRNSYLYLNEKQVKTLGKLKLSPENLFLEERDILELLTSDEELNKANLSSEKEKLTAIFNEIEEKSKEIDQNLIKVTQGELKRSLSAMENMEKRFKNAVKNKKEQEKSQISNLKSKVFPSGTYLERRTSFLDFILRSEKDVFQLVKDNNTPLDNSIKVVVY